MFLKNFLNLFFGLNKSIEFPIKLTYALIFFFACYSTYDIELTFALNFNNFVDIFPNISVFLWS
jgi:hypothetical protein